tara:strand:- start:346 stop:534 length:189 start_codon:yes stop_codon:yes gene_type:complete
VYKQQKGIIKKNRYSSIGRFKIEIDTNFLLNPQISYFVKNISQIIKKIDEIGIDIKIILKYL